MKRVFTEREKNIFIVLITAIAVFCATQFMVGPLQEEIDFLSAEIDAQWRSYKKEKKILAKSQSVDEVYQIYQSTLTQRKSDEEELSGFLSRIEKVSSKMDLTLSNLKPNKVRKEGAYNQFSVSLTLQSSFLEVVEFMSILQRKPYHFYIDEIKIESISRKNEGLVRTRMNLSKILIPQEL